MREVFGDVELGPALPHNVGASRTVPQEIVGEMERVVLATPSSRQLLDAFIREHEMNGPEGTSVQIRLDIRAELVVVANSEQGTSEVLEGEAVGV